MSCARHCASVFTTLSTWTSPSLLPEAENCSWKSSPGRRDQVGRAAGEGGRQCGSHGLSELHCVSNAFQLLQ